MSSDCVTSYSSALLYYDCKMADTQVNHPTVLQSVAGHKGSGQQMTMGCQTCGLKANQSRNGRSHLLTTRFGDTLLVTEKVLCQMC